MTNIGDVHDRNHMPTTITVRNVNYAFQEGWWKLRVSGVRGHSRNGEVLKMPGPVITTYLHPMERVLFDPLRDANPVFHLMEFFWMIAGQDDVAWLSQFNSRISEYADDGVIHGAYGHRWRGWFGPDQIQRVIEILIRDPNSRQAVIAMWDPTADLFGDWKDCPCNTHIYFDLSSGRLDMTVCCRSNDMLWGAYGANAVHFSFLQEVIADQVGVEVDVYHQMSNNFHVYPAVAQVSEFLISPPFENYDLYSHRECRIVPILRRDSGEVLEDLYHDALEMIKEGGSEFRTDFCYSVAHPLREAYLLRKAGENYSCWKSMKDCDWKIAFGQWLERRES